MAHQLEVVGPGLRNGRAGEWSSFIIEPIGENTEGLLGNIVVGIDGVAKPELDLSYGKDKIFVRYEPKIHGDYRIEITKDGAQIPGSPFKCKVAPANKPKPSKVRVKGEGLTNAKVNASNEVIVDVTEAFILTKPKVSMQGKTFGMRKYGKPDVLTTEDEKGFWRICYKPHFAGPYKMYIEFIEGLIPGSPFPINVIDPNAPPEVQQQQIQEAPPLKEKPRRVLFSLESLQAQKGKFKVSG